MVDPLEGLAGALSEAASRLPATWTEYDRRLMASMQTLARIQNKDGAMIPFRPNPMQEDYFGKRTQADIILKGRQMGATTGLQLEFTIEAMTTPGMEVLYVAQRDDSAKRLFEITTRLYHAMPAELRLPNVSDSTHKLTFDFGGGRTSTIEIGTAGSKSFGRGRPVHRALFTEVAFYEGNEENTMAGIIAAMPGPDSAIPGRYTMESTANGQSGNFYEQWMAAEEERSSLTPHFYGWWWDPSYKIAGQRLTHLSDEEQYLVREHQLTDDQIRWRRWQMGQYSGRTRGAEFFQQEFPESPSQAFMAIGDTVFDREALDTAQRGVTPPTTTVRNGTMQYWQKRRGGAVYVVAVDQASGEVKDASNKPTDYQVATVWNTAGNEQVATFRARIPQTDFIEVIKQLSDYYNHALVVVERNMAQYGFINMLYDSGVSNLYIHEDGRAGWPTNAGTKPVAIQNFEDVCKSSGCTIRSANLLKEARNYRWLRRRGVGSMGAAPGSHDDELMTAVMALMPAVTMQAYNSRYQEPTRKVEAVKLW